MSLNILIHLGKHHTADVKWVVNVFHVDLKAAEPTQNARHMNTINSRKSTNMQECTTVQYYTFITNKHINTQFCTCLECWCVSNGHRKWGHTCRNSRHQARKGQRWPRWRHVIILEFAVFTCHPSPLTPSPKSKTFIISQIKGLL